MRVLLTNAVLTGRTGTEVATIELARALSARGHHVVVFTRVVGASAQALRAQDIEVTDKLDELDFTADVIHGNHNVELVHGLIRFPYAPGVFVCHDPTLWLNSPPDLTRIRAYVSVCGLTGNRIRRELPRVADQVRFLPNAVDVDRFLPRTPLPLRPRRALALTKNVGHLHALRVACRRLGIPLDFLGPGVGEVVNDLPERLPTYDLVFATARSAIEAMAVGCAVIVVDERGLGGLATSDVMEDWRTKNFGSALLTRPVTADGIAAEIARYDSRDAAIVADNVRTTQPLAKVVSQYEQVYREAIATHQPVAQDIEARELSRLMQQWLPMMNGLPPIATQLPRSPRAGFSKRLRRSIWKRSWRNPLKWACFKLLRNTKTMV